MILNNAQVLILNHSKSYLKDSHHSPNEESSGRCMESRTSGEDLPSPASSAGESETSDYQRSTPSPRDHDSGIGSLEEFSDTNPPDQGLGDEDDEEEEDYDDEDDVEDEEEEEEDFDDDEDQEVSRNMRMPSKLLSSPSGVGDSEKAVKVLRQVRVALEKLPDEKLPRKFADILRTSSTPQKRRRHRDKESTSNGKKFKYDINGDTGTRGKITEYLSEMKHFTALRKEKLDRVLNLKTENPAFQNLKKEVSPDRFLRRLESIPPRPLESEKKNIQVQPPAHEFEIPKTVLRFPIKNPNAVQCRWESCGEEFESSGKLLDHLKNKHASLRVIDESQKYRCLWEGCKVYGKSSCSKSWLEKHVANHGGNKPFQCIVDGCKQRFSTQPSLERHVNSHFKSTTLPQPGGGGGSVGGICRKSVEPSSLPNTPASSSGTSTPKVISKVIKKAGRKFKYRKTIFSARIFDLFDVGIMARVQEKLVNIESSAYSRYICQDKITFSGSIIAKKRSSAGKTMFLMRWTPRNLLDDEWVDKINETAFNKTLKICSLPESVKAKLSNSFIKNSNPRLKRKFNPSRLNEALS